MPQIAIIGAGLSGLAAAFHLCSSFSFLGKIDVFDGRQMHENASAASMGLMHAYPGRWCRKAWHAEEALDYSLKLIEKIQALSNTPLILNRQIYRIPQSPTQQTHLQKIANRHSEFSSYTITSNNPLYPLLSHLPIFQVEKSYTIHNREYLKSLKKYLETRSVSFIHQKIDHLSELRSYDIIVIAAGFEANSISPKDLFFLSPTLGHSLVVSKPAQLPLTFPTLVGSVHLTSTIDNTITMGSTYIKDLSQDYSQTVIQELRDRLHNMLPLLNTSLDIIELRQGIRATCSQNRHLPIVGFLQDNIWLMTGMGSKGLLYHSYLGYLLAKAILHQTPNAIPLELRKILG